MPNPLIHWELMVSDVARTKAFLDPDQIPSASCNRSRERRSACANQLVRSNSTSPDEPIALVCGTPFSLPSSTNV